MPSDPRKIIVPFLNKSDIQRRVDDFCGKYKIDRADIPLDVELVVEADLRLRLRPEKGLTAKVGVDACLFADRSTMMVDAHAFDKCTPRLRFTIAHEIGHYVLHEDVYKHAVFASQTEWLEFFDTLPEETHRWIEYQANQFAGRLLIEGSLLKKKFQEQTKLLKGTQWEAVEPLPQPVVEFMCSKISGFFGVSDLPVYIRLQDEGIWRPD